MGKPYSSEKTETYHQVVERHYDGHGELSSTEIWEKDSAECTSKENYSRVVDGERYDYYGNHIGSAGDDD